LTALISSPTLAEVDPTEAPHIPEQVNESQGNYSQGTLTPPPPTPIGPNNPPWGSLVAIGFWIASVFLLAVVPIITAIPYMVYKATTGAAFTQQSAMADKNFLFFTVVGVFPAHAATLLLAWLIVTRAGRYPFWKTLGWDSGGFPLWKSILIAVALLGLGLLITWLYGGKKTQLEELINSSYQTRIATALLAATTAPLVEEIIYRGILYSAFQRAIGVFASVFIVSVLFAGVHVAQYFTNISVILVITLLSFTLTIVRAYTGRLLPSYIIHLVFNGIQSVMLIIGPLIEKPEQTVPTPPTPGLIEFILRHLS
jgi:uncharacterized protein